MIFGGVIWVIKGNGSVIFDGLPLRAICWVFEAGSSLAIFGDQMTISKPEITINNKYGAKYAVPNKMIFAMTTNEEYTHGMSEDSRRDVVYSPSWLGASNLETLANPEEKAAHRAHYDTIKALAIKLAVDSVDPEHDEWGAALYAMLLDIDCEANGFTPTGQPPQTAAKKQMALASTSAPQYEKDTLCKDFGTRLALAGGVVFTTKTFDDYLKHLGVQITGLTARKVLETKFGTGRVISGSVQHVGEQINNIYWNRMPHESAKVRIWSISDRAFAEANQVMRTKWINASTPNYDGSSESFEVPKMAILPNHFDGSAPIALPAWLR